MFRNRLESLLSHADVEFDGDRPWDIQVHNEGLYRRVLAHGALGAGESYMDGWWDCDQLDELFCRIALADLEAKIQPVAEVLRVLWAKLANLQKPSRAFQVGRRHYDIGNDLYRHMLGESMIYSCGYWKDAATLEEAQQAKLDLVCRKLGLRPGMRVLDIGCGWGGAAKFAAERYQVEVVGITVSEEQVRLGKDMCRGLPVEIRLQDYRDLADSFDRVFSIGMFEHVGCRNYATFMRIVRDCLRPGGLFLLHTIGMNRSLNRTDPWTERYIFPNSMLPSPKHIGSAIEGLFVLEDWYGFGTDYDRTLMCWLRNFLEHWDLLKASYDERFYRMWTYFLLSSAGSFRGRRNQLWQIVLSPTGVPGGYHPIR